MGWKRIRGTRNILRILDNKKSRNTVMDLSPTAAETIQRP
ncbi:17470_t:CDS:2 [Cetraspora pellucida]|uniref:17470_t:CDS:1 n=1 Tax=Cetraspora pellucida TaxID=1433469 RepID=A0A9N9A4A6_9GLOM|nr:17470_t:CDS:2 [Cetraspora pellucida]